MSNKTSQVAEVVAMYGTTVLDVAHVGQTAASKTNAPVLLLLGGTMLVGGLGLFAYEVSQPWQKYGEELRTARAQGLTDPAKPGAETGPLGLCLALLGLVPLLVGSGRRRDKIVTNYTIGEGHGAAFHMPPNGLPDPVAFPLVCAESGRFSFNFTRAMNGEIILDGEQIPVDDLVKSGRAIATGSLYSFPLLPNASCRLRLEPITFHVRSVDAGASVAGRGGFDWSFFSYVGGTGAVLTTLWVLMRSVPDDMLALEIDDQGSENRFARYMMQPDQVDEEQTLPALRDSSDERSGGQGQRHEGEEGKMGKPTSKKAAGLYAMKGPRDALPQMARIFDPDVAARQAGILGLMQQQSGHFLASPYGGAFAVGNDDEDVWGGLVGTEIGEAYGLGGLGIVGAGHSGGGTAGGLIGLGNTGLIHKGGGGGPGANYGPDGGTGFGPKRTPKREIRLAKASVQGALDKDIIRRIVRAHENEIRACYNQGLTKDPNLAGRVAVSFAITGTGIVGSSAVQESSLKDGSVANCMAKAVKRWKFPKPRGGGNVIVSYPFVLGVS